MARAVILDGLNLQEGDYRITAVPELFSAPEKEVKTVDLAREDGSKVVFERYLAKDSALQGYILTDTEEAADLALDTLKRYAGRKNIELKVGYAGGYRIWAVEVEAVSVARAASDLNYIPFTMRITAAYPLATDDTEATLVDETGITSSSSTIGVDVAGTYKAVPQIVITINAIDPDTTAVALSVGNPASQQTITVESILEAGDVVTIDCVAKLVYINSTSVPATGRFPVWEPGGGTLELSDTATTRDIDIIATYAKRYL